MHTYNLRNFTPSILLFFTVVFIDQFSKFLVELYFPWLVIKNRGVALSFFSSFSGVQIGVLVCVAIVLICLILWKKILDYPAILVLAGGVSNLISRIRGGSVVDFLSLSFIKIPLVSDVTFNFADMAVVAGGMWLAAILIFDRSS